MREIVVASRLDQEIPSTPKKTRSKGVYRRVKQDVSDTILSLTDRHAVAYPDQSIPGFGICTQGKQCTVCMVLDY